MPTPVVAAAYRTPQGARDGVLADLRSESLSIPLVDTILAETGLDGDVVDDVQWGCAQQRGPQDNNLARVIALLSDLGASVPGATINRWCASSMEALTRARDAVATGTRECVVAGGVESMSTVPMDGTGAANLHPAMHDQYDVSNLQMGATAETVATRFDVSREAQDEYALESHRRAAEATAEGRFDDELVPIETDAGRIETDGGIRRETSLDSLSSLPPAFEDGGTVTAGNASQMSDGAAALLVTSEAFAEDYGLDVLATIGPHSVAGVDPRVMGIAPVPATRDLLAQAGTTIDEYGLVELNEAFASQTLHCQRELDIPRERLNVNGGAIALGHPLGATGARLAVTLVHEMARRDVERGLATLCVGFGQGQAIELRR